MATSGLGGPILGVVLLPGLLAAGVGTLIFVGLDAWTGLGTFSLAPPRLPHPSRPDAAEFGWAVLIGAVAPFAGWGIRWPARRMHGFAERQPLLVLPLAGLAADGLAVGYAEATGKGSDEVLFPGQSALGPLVQNSATYTVWALLALFACKALAYGISLGSFRSGPIFLALFIGTLPVSLATCSRLGRRPRIRPSPAQPARAGPGTAEGSSQSRTRPLLRWRGCRRRTGRTVPPRPWR